MIAEIGHGPCLELVSGPQACPIRTFDEEYYDDEYEMRESTPTKQLQDVR